MLDLSVIILTYNEEIHIRRCIEMVSSFAKRIYVVDSFSSDRTVQIAEELGAEVIQHEWLGNQAEQFNWMLDNSNIETEWILRLDADEYLLPDLVAELNEVLPKTVDSVSAFSLSLARAFQGRILRHGIVNDVRIVRLFRRGKARYEKRLMDEHLSVLSGDVVLLKNQFVDDNIMPIGSFIDKHNDYASREAALLLDAEYHLSDNDDTASLDYGENVARKRAQKERYARLPLFWRGFGYFLYRYIFKLGFLDGTEGFLWDFLQGWWYRTLVDTKVYEIKRRCGDDPVKIKELLQNEYGVHF